MSQVLLLFLTVAGMPFYVLCKNIFLLHRLPKRETSNSWQQIFKKNFIVRFTSKFAAEYLLKIPPHLICVATLHCETLLSETEQIGS